jgi:cell division protein FtsB
MSTSALEQENKDLIQKLARTQEERAILEEKVRHLESSSSSMANDLIQQYAHDKRGSTSGKKNFLLQNYYIYIF